MAPPKKRDDNWVDGLRGCASFIVVTGHLCTAFANDLHNPANTENGPIKFFQLPFLRLCVSGRASVAIFFIITGFVNSISSVKHSRSDNTIAGLTGLARSTFTRSGRLIFPSTLAITISWFLSQIGAFKIAARSDSPWIRMTSKYPHATITEAVTQLFRTVVFFWQYGVSKYDPTHWTLALFLSGSFRVYVVILAISLVKKQYWYWVIALLYCYSWITNDNLVGMNVFSGLMLAQMHVDLGSRANSILPKVVPSILILVGVFLCCFPQHKPEYATWSRILNDIIASTTPKDSDHSRYASSVGSFLLMIGIFFSRNAKRVLTSPVFNFLGRVSFSVYLLHNILIRTILVWMIYGANAAHTPEKDDKGNLVQIGRANSFVFFFAIPIYYAVLYLVAYMWSSYVDPMCGKVLDWMKQKMFKENPNLYEKPIPLPNHA